MTATTLADSIWTPGDTLTLVGLILTAAALILSPLVTRFVMRKADRDRWRRDRLTDAFATMMTIHAARDAWRKSWNHDPATHPPDTEPVPALLRLFGAFEAEKRALIATAKHLAYRAAADTLRNEVAEQHRPLTVTPVDLLQLGGDAFNAEWACYEQARQDLGLDADDRPPTSSPTEG